jgi:plastocyanin
MNLKHMSVVGGMFLLTVCSKGEQSAVRAAPPAPPASTSSTASDSLTVSQSGATITGKIKFTGTAPRNAPIDMSEEATCKAKYKTTPPAEETVVAGPANALSNVFVYVTSGLPAGAKYQAPAAAVVLDQDGCRYHPHVFGIMVGQTLEIRNSDPVLHNIKAIAKKNRPFNVSQPSAGMKTNRTFSAPEVMVNLECNVHGWMKAFLGVRPDPFYAVTGPDGSFSIKGLPPGTYTIEAWHERFGTQTATVTVTGTESKTANITFAAR